MTLFPNTYRQSSKKLKLIQRPLFLAPIFLKSDYNRCHIFNAARLKGGYIARAVDTNRLHPYLGLSHDIRAFDEHLLLILHLIFFFTCLGYASLFRFVKHLKQVLQLSDLVFKAKRFNDMLLFYLWILTKKSDYSAVDRWPFDCSWQKVVFLGFFILFF